MKPFSVSLVALGVLMLAATHEASAQPTQGTPDVLPPPPDESASSAGPRPDTPEKKPVTPAAGYAYSDKPTPSSRTSHHSRYRARGPVVNMPGFEQTNDGGSRLFVQLSQTVPVEERKAQGSVTYVLKGASPRVWNNTNALVTVHFNTPVSRARLVPQGADLLFIIELRSAVSPTWKISDSQDKTAILAIDFPKGDYLSGGVVEPQPRAAARPARRRGGRKTAPPQPPPSNEPPIKINDSNIDSAKP